MSVHYYLYTISAEGIVVFYIGDSPDIDCSYEEAD
jgi:hypothetical protein